ncbi:hypothetical protein Aduo_011777 [Ancylostoma duodenale]
MREVKQKWKDKKQLRNSMTRTFRDVWLRQCRISKIESVEALHSLELISSGDQIGSILLNSWNTGLLLNQTRRRGLEV